MRKVFNSWKICDKTRTGFRVYVTFVIKHENSIKGYKLLICNKIWEWCSTVEKQVKFIKMFNRNGLSGIKKDFNLNHSTFIVATSLTYHVNWKKFSFQLLTQKNHNTFFSKSFVTMLYVPS